MPSTGTCQYVVAVPSTQYCCVLDAVRDRGANVATISTAAADAIITLVKKHGYLVDYILETQCSTALSQSATWYLRMQFSDLQGWPPQVFSEGTVSALERMWQPKYGADSPFVTKLRGGLANGEFAVVGRMRVRRMHLPSFGTPQRRGFLIGKNLFGAHSLATLSQDIRSAAAPEDVSLAAPLDRESCNTVWTSMQRTLSLPEETRVYLEYGDGGDSHPEPFDEGRHCRISNGCVGLNASEFFVRWEGERKSRLQGGQQRVPSKHFGKKR
ncbi:hypothetical protein B0A55_13784 [Friedmanniomyces simplex]|uniref:Uncharacterized protein n=1 Tax=Friedmanniomyces simplex TaxID=329884 RepID=A0A4V5ND17_9PEZI|nr:hypothetical protein B0A55_13784 [Friedmanniomyces simplex]